MRIVFLWGSHSWQWVRSHAFGQVAEGLCCRHARLAGRARCVCAAKGQLRAATLQLPPYPPYPWTCAGTP